MKSPVASTMYTDDYRVTTSCSRFPGVRPLGSNFVLVHAPSADMQSEPFLLTQIPVSGGGQRSLAAVDLPPDLSSLLSCDRDKG
jgi:hypothetical protein